MAIKETKTQNIPYRCYACRRYDGTFGPDNDEQHTHTCEKCKEISEETKNDSLARHTEEYVKNQGQLGEETLPCDECGRERDECTCRDNRVVLDAGANQITLTPPVGNRYILDGPPMQTVGFRPLNADWQHHEYEALDAPPEPDQD